MSARHGRQRWGYRSISARGWPATPGRAGTRRPINVKWFKHQGPGDAAFAERTASVEWDAWTQEGGAKVTTTVTFSEPGDYLLRLLAFNVIREFEFQCCWTNGFVPVTVAP